MLTFVCGTIRSTISYKEFDRIVLLIIIGEALYQMDEYMTPLRLHPHHCHCHDNNPPSHVELQLSSTFGDISELLMTFLLPLCCCKLVKELLNQESDNIIKVILQEK